jgi:UDP:flavonoid glycosyltransferase YjiC (YdhE family)
MRIIFLALGSTGDILPYATLAKALQGVGYRPVFVTTENYRPLLDRMGLACRLLPGDAQATIAQAGANTLRLMQSFAALSRSLPTILDPSAAWLQESLAIINQMPIGLYGFDLAERLAIPHVRVAVIPLTATADFPMMGWPTQPALVPGYNKLGYRVYERLTWLTMRRAINRWRTESLHLPAMTGAAYLRRLNGQPLLYGFSPRVVPRPTDWPDSVQVTGYWFPEEAAWQPPGTLLRFLEDGSAPVFIGFGSMPVEDPQTTMTTIVQATTTAGLRAIVQSGWARLKWNDLPQHLYALDYAPYSWLFPRMAAVIHHGGSGTTAAGLRAGVPGMITPFTFDQEFWGRRLAALGAGLPPAPVRKITQTRLARSMIQLTSDNDLQARAAAVGQRLQSEDGTAQAVQLIMGYLGRP